MLTTTRTSVASTGTTMAVVAALLLASSVVKATDDTQITTLRVIVYDHVGVSGPVLGEAIRTADRIYRQARVDLVWTIYDTERLAAAARNPGSDVTPIDNAVFIYLLTPAMSEMRRRGASVLGEAMPGSQLAWIHTQRVEALANARREDLGVLLGHVVAHEMGHLLLPVNRHTVSGLMRASLNVPDVVRGGLWFSSEEANGIRARVSGVQLASAR